MARGQKATPRGDWSPERKETQNAWKREKRATLSATVDKETAAAFRAICSRRGLSVNAAISALIDMCIASGDLIRAPGDQETTDDQIDRRGDDQTADAATVSADQIGAGSIDHGGPATASQRDQANENDTPGTVCRHPVSDTPGPVD